MKRDKDWLELELDNWARWAIGGWGYVGHCGSVEHRYNAEHWGDYEGPPRKSVVPVNALRAIACERAINALPHGPQPYPWIVAAHYLRRGAMGRVVVIVPVRRVRYRMARATYYRALDAARVMLGNLLQAGAPDAAILAPGPRYHEKIACNA